MFYKWIRSYIIQFMYLQTRYVSLSPKKKIHFPINSRPYLSAILVHLRFSTTSTYRVTADVFIRQIITLRRVPTKKLVQPL